MAVYIYPVSAEKDFPRLANLLSRIQPHPGMRLRSAGVGNPISGEHIAWQVAAIADNGQMVGYAAVGRDSDMRSRHFWLAVVVDQAFRGQGIGAMLYDDVASFAWEQGADNLEVLLCDEDRPTRQFFEHRGFQRDGDCLHIQSLANRGRIPQAQRELYELIRALELDVPAILPSRAC